MQGYSKVVDQAEARRVKRAEMICKDQHIQHLSFQLPPSAQILTFPFEAKAYGALLSSAGLI